MKESYHSAFSTLLRKGMLLPQFKRLDNDIIFNNFKLTI